MALDIPNATKQRLKVSFLILVGFTLLAGGGLLAYDSIVQKGSFTAPPGYKYTINQSLNNSVDYVDNSYYPNGPTTDNTAFVTDLTESFDTTLHYSYKASDVESLRYTYSVEAAIKGIYGVPGSEEDSSNVWVRRFQLVEPSTSSIRANSFSLDKTVTVPFDTYRKLVEDFRLGLTLPVSSEVELKFTIKVEGNVSGEPFSDTRTSTVSTPLNVQIYQLASKYDKTINQEVTRPALSNEDQWRTQLELIGAVVMAILAFIAIFRALYSGVYKSAYQRELEKIYRYHDGIIIRASKGAKISANKTIVPVSSFDDILNLEEELKAPIIASPSGETATRFMIADGDLVYMYVLGKEPASLPENDEIQSIEHELTHPTKMTDVSRQKVKRTAKKSTKK